MRLARRGLWALLAAFAGPAAAQADEGRAIFLRPDKGYCIACHQLPDGAGPATRADLGPRLDGALLKGWDRARLRELLADPTRANPDSVMPPYGRHRILEPAEIERVIDFLHALP
jgi:sulfur-oxidizing protein SoxX